MEQSEKTELMIHEPQQVALNPTLILMQAIQSGTDIAVLEKLMDLQERFEAREAKKAYDKSLAAFKREVVVLEKDGVVDFVFNGKRTNYTHSTLANDTLTLNPFLGKFGLNATFRTFQTGEKITIRCILAHEDGHSESTELFAVADSSGGKNALQAMGSTMSYLEKYTFRAITGVFPKDAIDDDGNSHQQPEKQALDPINDKTHSEHWISAADKHIKDLARWFKHVTPEAKKAMPADQWAKFSSYVNQCLETAPKVEESPEEKALDGWLNYLKTITNVDILTTTWEEKVEPMLKNFKPVNQEKLEQCRKEVANKIMEGVK